MPWRETAPMDQRREFIAAHRSRSWSMSELCDRFSVSRKTGYKWLRRVEQEGWAGLKDRSRRPHNCPWETARPVELAIVETRQAHPSWGPVKILEYLSRRQPQLSLPAPSTAGKLLERWDLVQRRSRRRLWRHPSGPLLQPLAANEVVTADFKGQFRTGDSVYCYPLTVADSYSRYLLRCQALASVATAEARPVFERLFREVGLPGAIRTDNGAPFSATGLHGLCGLSVWWMQLGIQHQRIRPGHPQDNGRHERMHRTLKAATARPPASNRRAQQRRFDDFRKVYNEERPHQALAGETPASLWRPSDRAYPARIADPDYPGHFEKRLVSSAGCFRFRKQVVFISQALKQQWIGLEEVDDGLWSVHFYSVLLARLDERTMTLST
jgi:putative transposase